MQTETGTAESKPALTLHPVTDADLPFIRELYASTRNEEMATVPWTDEQRAAFVDMQFQAQLNHYREYYPGATHDLVLVSGRPVGRLYVDRQEREIEILDLTISARERNAGIGSLLLSRILDEAAKTGKTVGIFVENFNPSTRLFERLGFRETDQEGFHQHLQWFPPESAA